MPPVMRACVTPLKRTLPGHELRVRRRRYCQSITGRWPLFAGWPASGDSANVPAELGRKRGARFSETSPVSELARSTLWSTAIAGADAVQQGAFLGAQSFQTGFTHAGQDLVDLPLFLALKQFSASPPQLAPAVSHRCTGPTGRGRGSRPRSRLV